MTVSCAHTALARWAFSDTRSLSIRNALPPRDSLLRQLRPIGCGIQGPVLVRVPREVGRRVLLRHSDVTVACVAYTISCTFTFRLQSTYRECMHPTHHTTHSRTSAQPLVQPNATARACRPCVRASGSPYSHMPSHSLLQLHEQARARSRCASQRSLCGQDSLGRHNDGFVPFAHLVFWPEHPPAPSTTAVCVG